MSYQNHQNNQNYQQGNHYTNPTQRQGGNDNYSNSQHSRDPNNKGPMVYTSTTQMNPTAQVNYLDDNNNNGKPREWTFGLFDCFADYGLCNYHILIILFFFYEIN